jgi:SAM-dependent methyltransferase
VKIAEQSGNEIRSLPRPTCHLCGSEGHYLYTELTDRLFNAPGEWNFRKCNNLKCRLVWLDPIPLQEDIYKAYQTYYTHGGVELEKSRGNGFLTDLYDKIRGGYLSLRYDYKSENSGLRKVLGFLLYLLPGHRAYTDFSVFYLQASKGGRFLEVGCGGGSTLKLMKELGWGTEGVDIDPIAGTKARRKGLKVKVGTLPAQQYPDNYFDAIGMSHLIEHIHDPIELLQECFRIIRPGGCTAVITPNGESWGHKIFKRDWRGLEPPRHLHIFTCGSLCSLTKQAGFNKFKIFTGVGHTDSMFIASRLLQRPTNFEQERYSRSLGINIWARAYQLAEWGAIIWGGGNVGEDLILIAQK